MLLWKVAQNALPVGENLLHRQVCATATCPHCGEKETTLHLFFHCPFAMKIWDSGLWQSSLNAAGIDSTKEGITKALKLLCLPPTGVGDGPLAPWIIWSIWTARNQLIFNKKHISFEESLLVGTIRAREWQEAQSSLHPKPKPAQTSTCALPPTSAIKIFTDAAWKGNGSAGLGWIFKDQFDLVFREGSQTQHHVRSPLVAEALATLAAVRVAIESEYTKFFFASDSLNLVKALNSETPHKELHGILHDILTLSSNFELCSFNFIPRDCNRQADALAKEALLFVMNPN